MIHKKFTILVTTLLTTIALSSCNIIIGGGSHTSTPSTTNIAPEAIEITPADIAITIGDTFTFTANVLPEGAKQDVTWKSSKLNVATVDENTGAVTGKAAGLTVITATSKIDSRIYQTAQLTVATEVIKAESIALDATDVTMKVGATKTIHASITPSNSTGGVSWSTSDDTVATVVAGKITAKGYGQCAIRATARSNPAIYTECQVNVEKTRVTSLSLEKHEISVATNSVTYLSATVLPTDADDKTINWTSSNQEYATVTSSGAVTALKQGTVTIIATSVDSPSITDSCTFTITDVHPTAMTLNRTSASVSLNNTISLSPVFTPSETSNKQVTWESTNPGIASVDENGVVTGVALGNTTVTATSVDGGFIASCDIEVVTLSKSSVDYNYEDLSEHSIYQVDAIPSNGSPKIIVVPIWFSDSSTYISSSEKATVKEDITKAYFGTNEETGWRSVKTFYEEESFGALTLDGTVTDWYECGYRSSSTSSSTTTSIVKSVASWFKQNNASTYADYDTNGDGYLDALVLIYAAPDYSSAHTKNDNLWAYCYWVQQAPGTASNPVPNVYFWASYDFMYSSTNPKIGNYGGGDASHCNVDAHTFIHEMGHILGLEDYYDYNGGYSASSGFSMQDHNVGAHDPFSRMALGWADPYVPTESITLTIGSMEDSGELILLSPNYQNSPFDEYILIELYTPTGLNKFDTDYAYSDGYYPQGAATAGCRIWHVDSRLATPISSSSYALETNPAIVSSKQYVAAFTNSTFTTGTDGRSSVLAKTATDAAANYRQLQLIRKNYTTDYKCGESFNSDNLFVTGDTFNMTTYGRCFYNRGKLNNGKTLGFSVSFDRVTSSGAQITITKE